RTFLGDLTAVDTYAKTEAARRYKYAPVQSGRPPAGATRRYPPYKSIRDRAIEDGLYADVETRKQNAVDNHLKVLSLSLGLATAQRIEKYVQTAVAPHIKTISDPPTSPTGNPIPVQPVRRETPTNTR